MRNGLIVVTALSLGCASCGRMETVVTPVTDAREELANGNWSGLVLDDGGRVRINSGEMLGDWVCGNTRVGPGVLPRGVQGICIPSRRVVAVESSEWKTGPADWIGVAITVVIMWPIMLIWGHSEHENNRNAEARAAEAAEQRQLDEAEAAARGEVLPPLPTVKSRRLESAFFSLASCTRADRDEADGPTLAGQVWRDQERCLYHAAEWFAANGEMAKARRLTFIGRARDRYEALLCGREEPGLNPPDKDLIDARAARTWMGEYRAVVADSRTYDYDASPDCSGRTASVALTAPEDEPALKPRAQAVRQAIAGFPLTDPAVLQAAVAYQSDQS
ncbi:MAG: hypothetical protein EON87_09025 [Brevundimonas sp.]|nr:MAG: hypothetical protein EON87_09025 [Brevundimonas sp.]